MSLEKKIDISISFSLKENRNKLKRILQRETEKTKIKMPKRKAEMVK